MRYIPHTADEIERMLETVGVASLRDLFATIPEKLQIGRDLALPRALGEQELVAELRGLAARNAHRDSHDWFLGAGVYSHFVPSVIDALVSRGEFTTAYTPYQPEISQGTLQAIFEWQTMICGLTGLDVANASMYDGASATAEAALMALRSTQRQRVVVSGRLHPHTLDVLRTYLDGLDIEIVVVEGAADGRSADPGEALDDRTACWIVQQPNFLGAVEDLQAAAERAHARGALLVVSVTEALSLALLEAPGRLGADIVCGEAQSFGIPMGLGGPHLGFLAARQALLRQLPGRLAGQTVDARGQRGFVLTLSTREQHIRREKATSNICTNQGLCLLMATIYLSLLGRVGLRELAELNLARAEYAKSRVRATPGLSLPVTAPTFNEFVVGFDAGDPAAALQRARAQGIVAGLDLATHAPELGPALLTCVTETSDRAAIDRWVAALAGERR